MFEANLKPIGRYDYATQTNVVQYRYGSAVAFLHRVIGPAHGPLIPGVTKLLNFGYISDKPAGRIADRFFVI